MIWGAAMKYIMKSGVLSVSGSGEKLAYIKHPFAGVRKCVALYDGDTQYHTDIDIAGAPPEKRGDVRYRVYTLKNDRGKTLMRAQPGYAKDEDPDVVGWPICRVPKVDHADILIAGSAYLLVMHNSQNYSLQNKESTTVLQIMHKGISGGWDIETDEAFDAQIICGLFVFCRYMEQENEFIIV